MHALRSVWAPAAAPLPGLTPSLPEDWSPVRLLGEIHWCRCLLLDALWWPSNNPCMPSYEPHAAPQGLVLAPKCLLPPGRSTRAASHAHAGLRMLFILLLCVLGTLSSAGSHLLRYSPKCCQGKEMLVPVQERVCRGSFYLLLKDSAGQALLSPFHQQWSRSPLHFREAWVEVSLYKVVAHLGWSWVSFLPLSS